MHVIRKEKSCTRRSEEECPPLQIVSWGIW